MRVVICPDLAAVATTAADIVTELAVRKPHGTLGLPPGPVRWGSTPNWPSGWPRVWT